MMVKYLFLLLLMCFSSCSESDHVHTFQKWMAHNGKLKILSTTGMIDDLVRKIGEEYIDAAVLIKGDLDPHSYTLVKGDDEKLAFSDLIFYNGLGLEHGPSMQNALSQNMKAIPLGDLIRKQSPHLILLYKGQIDPHLWMDISIWAETVPYIVEALSRKDPSHAEMYQKNGNALQIEMKAEHQKIKEILKGVPAAKRYLVTSHDAFNYFTRAYLAEENEDQQQWQQRFAAPEGLAPESQISASDIQEIIAHLKKYQVRVLFPESNVNKDSLRKIVQAANEKGIKVHLASNYLYADAMGKPGSDGDSYLKMMHHDASSIAQNLEQEL